MNIFENEEFQQAYELAQELSKRASELLLNKHLSREFHTNFKGEIDPVTSIDLECERLILEGIRRRFPQHLALSEETSTTLSHQDLRAEGVWIIDPIDGTVNFARGNPNFCTSIAFASRGITQFGIISAPRIEETYTAALGRGAACNGTPIRCSGLSEIKRSLVCTGFPYERGDAVLDQLMRRNKNILRNCQDLRRYGSAAIDICWVACGRLDAFYENLAPWDMAAAALIAKEAGAVVGHFGNASQPSELPLDLDSRDLLVSTPELFEKLKEILE